MTVMADKSRGSSDSARTVGQRLVSSIAVAVVFFVGGCSSREQDKPTYVVTGALTDGGVARVGSEDVTQRQVAALAAARGISPKQALDVLLFDALMASEAQATGVDKSTTVLVEKRALLASALLDSIKAEKFDGPVTDAEVEKFTNLHWLTMARPVARRTAHVVVMPKNSENAAQLREAKKLASLMAERLEGVTDPDRFVELAKQVGQQNGSSDLKVVAQKLPPVVKDGRVANVDEPPPPGAPVQTFDKQFVQAVFDLNKPGDMSGVVKSKFGYHVILLTQIIPPQMRSARERREKLTPEIRTSRTNKEYKKLVDSLRAKAKPHVLPQTDRIFENLELRFPRQDREVR